MYLENYADEVESCPNAYYYKGHRSYGNNIPDRCQGAYFPGDEPSVHCRYIGESCPYFVIKDPTSCCLIKHSVWYCPYCSNIHLLEDSRTGSLNYFCPNCLNSFSENTGLASAYQEKISDLSYCTGELCKHQYKNEQTVGQLHEIAKKVICESRLFKKKIEELEISLKDFQALSISQEKEMSQSCCEL